jgi:diguanylate cyclase (GGDEF)-like protein
VTPAPLDPAWAAAALLDENDGLLDALVADGPAQDFLALMAARLGERFPGSVVGVGGLDHFGRVDYRVAGIDRAAVLAIGESPLSDPAVLGTETVCVTDPDDDPRCAGLSEIVTSRGVGSVWARSMRDCQGRVIGAILVLHAGPDGPNPAEEALLARYAPLGALALEREDLYARLEHGSLHDELTGLPNRLLLGRRIAVAAQRRRGNVALLFADLDQFKVVNDSLGHALGDELLAAIGVRFGTVVRPDDTVGRFGGDEFVVLCEGVSGEAEAVAIAGRLLEAVAEPIDLGPVRLNLSASVGIALLGAHDTADELLRNADLAMYRAKELGRGRYVVFEPALGTVVDERLAMERALHQALSDHEFHVLYQPQIRLSDGVITGVETLVRWDRPGQGLISPNLFVPVAEATGLVVPLGRWVLDQAVTEAAAWPSGPRDVPITVSVNLSAKHLADPKLEMLVAEVLERHGMDAAQLCLEVTESDLVYDLDGSAAVLCRLKDVGVRLAIDDFGTGYATLDYVRRFSMADVLKIDATFVRGLSGPGYEDRAIVAAAIALGRTLGFEIIAEGVEDERQRDVLIELGCDKAQGYLFSEAVPGRDVADLLRALPAG